jgi:hypothetical protein
MLCAEAVYFLLLVEARLPARKNSPADQISRTVSMEADDSYIASQVSLIRMLVFFDFQAAA